jgi:hypothetical protein
MQQLVLHFRSEIKKEIKKTRHRKGAFVYHNNWWIQGGITLPYVPADGKGGGVRVFLNMFNNGAIGLLQ